jgi:hypothetical protein
MVFVFTTSIITTSYSFAGEVKHVDSSGKDHDFGNNLLYVVTKPKDDKSECGFILIEKVKVVRFGDRSFLVGQYADFGEAPGWKASVGKTVWNPISDIVQMTEFKSLDEAKKYFEKVRSETEALPPTKTPPCAPSP